MARFVIQNDDVTGRERQHEYLLNVSEEGPVVPSPLTTSGVIKPAPAQNGKESGRLPVAIWDRGDKPLPTRSAPAQPRRPRFQSCLKTVRHLATALSELGHDLLVQPDVHFRRAIEGAGIAELLRQLLSGAKGRCPISAASSGRRSIFSNRNLRLARQRASRGSLQRRLSSQTKTNRAPPKG